MAGSPAADDRLRPRELERRTADAGGTGRRQRRGAPALAGAGLAGASVGHACPQTIPFALQVMLYYAALAQRGGEFAALPCLPPLQTLDSCQTEPLRS